jgi:hypothetical protein
MTLQKITLDSGEVAGVKWEAIGVSPACGFELVAHFGSIEKRGFSLHPLMLLSEEKRARMALELMLPHVAGRFSQTVAATAQQAVQLIESLTDEADAAVAAAKRLAARWTRTVAAIQREQSARFASS